MTTDLERFRDDALYLDKHRQELLDQYPERWVAVYEHQIVAVAKDMQKLVEKVKQKGLSPGHVYRAFLSAKDDVLILSHYTS
ncbi:MAG: DUF5678 domain-containing protein [Chloroflexi bacterium]|nr:DUF5678 domain-containing protein [Chloroflexota bacterium]